MKKYRSIGKLFWVRNRRDNEPINESNIPPYYSTAFCDGHGTIITVAHVFDQMKDRSSGKLLLSDPREAFFVPAMEDREDYHGRCCGFFHIEEVKKHKSYVSREYKGAGVDVSGDICRAKLGTGKKKVGQDFEPADVKDIAPLRITPFDGNRKRIKIVGYGQHQDGRMIIVRGKRRSEIVNRNEEVRLEVDNFGPLMGMSGGPWIPSGHITEAKGIQSARDKEKTHLPPRFSKIFFRLPSFIYYFISRFIGSPRERSRYFAYSPYVTQLKLTDLEW